VSDAAARGRIADPSLAPEGDRRIAWVARHAPVLSRVAAERLKDGALRGRRVAVVVHLEAKTAYLAILLAEAGAEVVVAGSNPMTTQDAVCAALMGRGIEVHAVHGSSREEFEDDLLAVVASAPEFIVDDGAELTARLLQHRPDLATGLRGVTEETTTGVARLRAMQQAGKLTFPAIAANDAQSKHLFDNRYGTGQTAIAAVSRLTNLITAGRRICIVGYGWVGKGLARYAEGMGAKITAVDVDPIPALEAFMDGHRVGSLSTALPDADVVITATGGIDALPRSAFPLLKDGVLLTNAGHHEREIDTEGLAAEAGPGVQVRPGITRYTFPDGRRCYLLAGGALVNIAGADGHPVEIMDLSFSVQALALHHLASNELAPRLHRLPAELDRAVARAKLAALGIKLDELTKAQRRFFESWEVSR
jgi:adenosylhomocysteinase